MNLETLITSVLMVGHSLFGPDNPVMLQQLLAEQSAAPAKITVEAQIINGAPLSYNWQHGDSAEGINARQRLAAPVDVVIVTEAIPLANHLKWSGTEQAITQYYERARATNPEVRFYLQETWHSLASGTGVQVQFDDGADQPWRNRLEQDLPRWQALVDEVNNSTQGDIRLLPAGQAMARLDDAIQAGTVPGLRNISQVFADDIHPNAIGFYYLSLVQYVVLSGQDPRGLPHQLHDRWGKAFAAPAPALAARLQELAWAAAQGADVASPALPQDPPPPPAEPAMAQLNGPVAQPVPQASSPRHSEAPPPERQPIAMNLMPLADWSPQAPFLDHFKTARPWVGHLPGQWGGATEADLRAAGYLDPDGWPTALPPELGSIGTVILTDLPETAQSLAGRYVLRFEGQGIVEVSGRAHNQRYGKGEVSFDYTPGPGPVEIRLQRIGRDGTYPRNITVVREDQQEAFAAGEIFNPRWLDLLDGFAALRFMDWMQTNNSPLIGWEDRPRVRDYSWARKGVPLEIMLELANQLGTDPWFNMPHQADDSYIRNFAKQVAADLDADLKTYVEYSNEVWNWQFDQARWADEQAQARWGGKELWMQFYGGRAAEVAQIWGAAFDSAPPTRLVRVLATQTGWLGLEEQILTAPLWQAEEADRLPPARYFDAYAVTGYFGGILGVKDRAPIVRAWIGDSQQHAQQAAAAKGLRGDAARVFIAAHQYDVASEQAAIELTDGLVTGDATDTLSDLLGRVLPYHKEVADRHGLDLIMYEGGSHVVGIGPMVEDALLTGFFTHFNYTPQMGALYAQLLARWQELGGSLFTAYADVSVPGKWGSWGALRSLSDSNPRWSALEAVK
ncbi:MULTISPECIES: hypothetical protein [Pseudophaeobacter]|jgi:hypothetical protein|uniref:hypothetical protein n=1 Tax=Pseudophaeobacter TaxID=1541822 RepID=UPI0024310BDB|nr:hypothetical protein [Pseudophaeobacter profundi]